ncbi:MAG: thiamine phosphate synthase [Gallionella sp.]|nr:thiamine phosphate synthase [Gallionella sp.]
MSLNQHYRISGLYAITPDEPNTAELLRKVRLVLQGGARVLQYRNKAANFPLRLEQAQALKELTREFSVPLIINDDVLLAQRVDAEGVHLGAGDASAVGARILLGSGKLIGISCYNRMGLARVAVRQGADYVAFGSFFASTVKPEAVAAPPDLLREARLEIPVPLVAIGGITAQNGIRLLEAGASALAVISGVFGADDIQGSAREFAALNFH